MIDKVALKKVQSLAQNQNVVTATSSNIGGTSTI